MPTRKRAPMQNFTFVLVAFMIVAASGCDSEQSKVTHTENTPDAQGSMLNPNDKDGGTILDTLLSQKEDSGSSSDTQSEDSRTSVDTSKADVVKVDQSKLEFAIKTLLATPSLVFFVIKNDAEVGGRFAITSGRIPMPYGKRCYESGVPVSVPFIWTGREWVRFLSSQIPIIPLRIANRSEMSGIPLTSRNTSSIAQSLFLDAWVEKNQSMLEAAIQEVNVMAAMAICQ